MKCERTDRPISVSGAPLIIWKRNALGVVNGFVQFGRASDHEILGQSVARLDNAFFSLQLCRTPRSPHIFGNVFEKHI